MINAEDINEFPPGISVWHAYDPVVKAELFSTALKTSLGTYLVDPIPINHPEAAALVKHVVGICITNSNHIRAVAEFAESTSAPIFVHHELAGTLDFPNAVGVTGNRQLSQGLTAIMIDGGPLGEMALHYVEDGGTMIIGDALINFDPHGFGFLPAKYCRNAKLMRRSLTKLLDFSFDRMLFAHGTPILSKARTSLEQLLASR